MICADCPKEITKNSRSGRCRSCAQRANYATWTPEQRELRSQYGKRHIAFLLSPDAMAKSQSPEVRRRAADTRRRTMMGWCPDHLLPTYRYLRDTKGMGKELARQALLPEIPGTVEYARRHIANANDVRRIKQDRAAMVGLARNG